MSHTTTAVVGRRCEPARASWKVAWWPRPVSGSVSARSRSEPISSAVRRQAAPWVASCSSSSTSSVPMAAGSSEASTRAPSSSPWAKRPTATSVSTPAARSSARLAAGGAACSPTVKSEIPSSTHAPIELERRGAQDVRQRAGRDRRPQGAAGAGRAREQRGAQRDEVERGVQQRVGDRGGVLEVGDVGDVTQQALRPGLAGQAAELFDARAEGAGALAQVVEVAVAQRLARLDVEHADGQAAGAQREARLGHDSGVGLEVVLARADVLDDHLGPLAVRTPHDPGAARQPVAGLPVAAQRGAPQASAAGEVDRGQQALLAGDVVDHRRRGGGGVRGSLERQAQQGGGHAHH